MSLVRDLLIDSLRGFCEHDKELRGQLADRALATPAGAKLGALETVWRFVAVDPDGVGLDAYLEALRALDTPERQGQPRSLLQRAVDRQSPVERRAGDRT